MGFPDPSVLPAVSSRVARLGLIATVLSILLLWMLAWDPVVAGRLRLAFRGWRRDLVPSNSSLLREDPPLGSMIPHVASAVPGDSPVLVVFVGDCAGCLPIDLSAWARLGQRTGPAEMAEAFAARVGLPAAAMIRDPDGALGRMLNASFLGRSYLITSQGRLRWIQKQMPGFSYTPFNDPEFPRAPEGPSKP